MFSENTLLHSKIKPKQCHCQVHSRAACRCPHAMNWEACPALGSLSCTCLGSPSPRCVMVTRPASARTAGMEILHSAPAAALLCPCWFWGVLFFLTVLPAVLWLGFVMKTALKTHRCSCSSAVLTQLSAYRACSRCTAGRAHSQDSWDVPDHTVPCSAREAVGSFSRGKKLLLCISCSGIQLHFAP